MSCEDCERLLRAISFYSNEDNWQAENGNILDSRALNDLGFFARSVKNGLNKTYNNIDNSSNTDAISGNLVDCKSIQKFEEPV